MEKKNSSNYEPISIDRSKETFNIYIDENVRYTGPVIVDVGQKKLEFENVHSFYKNWKKHASLLNNDSNDQSHSSMNDYKKDVKKTNKKTKILETEDLQEEDNDVKMEGDIDERNIDSQTDEDALDHIINNKLKEYLDKYLDRKLNETMSIPTMDSAASLNYDYLHQSKVSHEPKKRGTNRLRINFKFPGSKFRIDSKYDLFINNPNSRLLILGYDADDSSDRILFEEDCDDEITVSGDFGEAIAKYLGSFSNNGINYLIFIKENK